MKPTFWDKRAQGYDDSIMQHDSIYDKTIERTKTFLTKSDVVLDFACASGEFSLDLAPDVKKIQGIDMSAQMIAIAQQKTLDRQVENIRFDQVDVLDASLASNSFTAIIAFNIFHLLEDAPKVLTRLHDWLPTGGLLISQTPCLGERSWLFQAMIKTLLVLGVVPTILRFTITDVESLVSGSNFKIIESKLWDEKNAVQWIVAKKI